jgi:hypothetical protein
MDRSRVIIHNLISLDGRLSRFPADVGLPVIPPGQPLPCGRLQLTR